ncbi:MAG: response regulator transcription factor [Acidimicrobiales bacterium]
MTTLPNTVRVVVADHRPMVRAAFAALLGAEPGITVVGEADTGAAAIHVGLATHPDVVLMDVGLPVVDGVSATRQLLAACGSAGAGPLPRVLMVTPSIGDEYVYEGVCAGACGFVPADARPAELVSAVRRALVDDALVGDRELVRLVAEFTLPHEADAATARRDLLDEHQQRLVTAVASGYRDDEIARHLQLDAVDVEAQLADVRARIGEPDRTRVVLFAFRSGLARRVRPEPATAD